MNGISAGVREPLIAHLSTASHDGKVVVVGTGYDGVLYYTIRQSGFEDTVTRQQTSVSITGFEAWRTLPLDKAAYDASVVRFEAQSLTDQNHQPILRSLYGKRAARTQIVRTKLLSGLGHIYVFRIASNNRLVVSRFVLDGLTNELVPKMEVRYRRSGQRLTPDGGKGNRPGAKTFDSLGSRSVDDAPFCEPALELSFVGSLPKDKPWFSVELLNTGEHGKFRWHVFAMTQQGLQHFTVSASREGLFDIQDRLGSVPDPLGSGRQVRRTLPGIVVRTLKFEGQVSNAFDTCLYHNQIERETKSGPQLLKQSTRVMLSVPIQRPDRSATEVAVVSFAVNTLGMLAQVARSGPPDDFLRASRQQLLLPLTTLEDAKLIADRSPPPEGSIRRLDESPNELVEITTDTALEGQSTLKSGERVEITGTKSYDGVYTARNVARGEQESSFEIEAKFDVSEGQGHWKAIEKEPDGLIFENMIASYERTETGLKVTCLSHNIEDGDEIRISGSVSHDGVYPIRTVGQGDLSNSFEIERVWPIGEAVNLRFRRRRGLAFDGTGDFLEIGPVKLPGNAPRRRLECTVSAWVWIPDVTLGADAALADAQIETVFCDTSSGSTHLYLDRQGRPTFSVGFADGHVNRVRADKPLPTSRWVHLAAQLDYDGEGNGSTRLDIIVDGRIKGTQQIAVAKPLHLPLRNAFLRGSGLPLFIGTQSFDMEFPESITLEAWVNTAQNKQACLVSWEQNGLHRLGLQGGAGHRVVEWVNNGESLVGRTELTGNRWHHIAASYDEQTGKRAIYVNGVLDHQSVTRGESALAARRRELTAQLADASERLDAAEQAQTRLQDRIAAFEQSLFNLDEKSADLQEQIDAAQQRASAASQPLEDVRHNLTVLEEEQRQLRESFSFRGPVGDLVGNGGSTFFSVALSDDVELVGIDVREGSWLDALQLVPSRGSMAALGGSGGNLKEIRLPEGQWLVAIEGRFNGTRLLDLQFITNTGLLLPSGSSVIDSTDAFALVAPGGCEICGLWGHADRYIDSLGISVRTDPENRRLIERANAAVQHEESQLAQSPVHAAALKAFEEAKVAVEEMHAQTAALDTERSHLITEIDTGSVELEEVSLQLIHARRDHERATDALNGPLRTNKLWEALDSASERGEPLILGYVGGVFDETGNAIDQFRGAIAELRAWSTVRTPEQVIASSATMLEGTEPGLVGCWTLSETSARQMTDHSTTKSHLIRQVEDPVEWRTLPHRVPGRVDALENAFYQESFSVAAKLQPIDQDAIAFTAIGGYLMIPALKQSLPDGYTLSGWFWLNRYEGATLISLGSKQHQSNLQIGAVADGNALIIESDTTDGGAKAFACHGAIRLNEWVHLALSVTPSGEARILINAEARSEWQGEVIPIRRFDRGKNFIGRSPGSATGFMDGQIRDLQLWDEPLDIAGVKRSMHATTTESNSHLLHRWTMKTRREESKDVATDTGSATSAPAVLMGAASAVSVAQGVPPAPVNEFRGRISDLQLWSLNHPADAIRNVMHNQLSGSENGLLGYWKLGGIAEPQTINAGEAPTRITPDFSVEPHDATVHGEVYVSECELARASSLGRAVRYSNDELVGVTQGGRYRETLEFRALDADGYIWNTSDVSDADGLGNPIFGFRYWGKSSRFSDEVIEIAHTPFSFQAAGDGWLKATAEVTIPDGVNLLRSFELDQVRGRWSNQQQPPDDEWVQLSLRRHRLELVSDSVSMRSFVDELPLASLSDNAGELRRNIARLPGIERQVATRLEKLDDIHERLNALSNQPKYQREFRDLKQRYKQLVSQLSSLNNRLQGFVRDPLNYVQEIQAREAGLFLDLAPGTHRVCIWKDNKTGPLEWEFLPAGTDRPGQYKLRERRFDGYLTAFGRTDKSLRTQRSEHPGQYWRIHRSGKVYEFENVQYSAYLDVYAHGSSNGSRVVAWHQTKKRNQEWTFDQVGSRPVMFFFNPSNPNYWKQRAGFDRDFAALEQQRDSVKSQMPSISARIGRLLILLQSNENAEQLQRRRAALESQIRERQDMINTINADYLREATTLQAEALTMSMVARDRDSMTTYGALLGFASPATGLVSAATAEGNVQLSYFDQSGAMRFTQYDATSDRANTLYEQWIADAIRCCPRLATQGAWLALDQSRADTQALTLPPRDFTIEAWFHYPASTSRGTDNFTTDQSTQVLVSDDTGRQAPIAIYDGRRLGAIVDGFFHDSGVDLATSLSKGWHHVAARTRGANTQYFLDGQAVGHTEEQAREINLFAARFGTSGDSYLDAGTSSLLSASTHSFTLQFWARWDSFTSRQSPVDARIDNSRRLLIWASGSAEQGSLYVNSHAVPPPGVPALPHRFDAQLVAHNILRAEEWVNVAVSINGSSDPSIGVLYINGHEAARGELILPPAGASQISSLGRNPDGSSFKGALSQVQLWSGLLSIDEIRRRMFVPPPISTEGDEKELPESLAHYWSMNAIGSAEKRRVEDHVKQGAVPASIKGSPQLSRLDPIPSGTLTHIGNNGKGVAPAGQLCELRIWSVALSDEEIRANSRMLLTGNEPDLMAYYPLNDMLGGRPAKETTGRFADALPSADAETVACTANIGHPGSKVALFNGGNSTIEIDTIDLQKTSFTIEFWVRRQDAERADYLIEHGPHRDNHCLHIGFRSTGAYFFSFWRNSLNTTFRDAGNAVQSGENEWLHIAHVWTYNSGSNKGEKRLYVNGQYQAHQSDQQPLQASGKLVIGAAQGQNAKVEMAEIRIWRSARTADQVAAMWNRRLATVEPSELLLHLPLDGITPNVAFYQAAISLNNVTLVRVDDLPIVPGSSVVTAEYSTVSPDPQNRSMNRAMLRRFVGVPVDGGRIDLIAGRRIEELDLKWIGNAQFEPTLLGYIEGAPPVPSENLTVSYDYDGATSVELRRSNEVSYSWNRSKEIGGGFDINAFIGAKWDADVEVGFIASISSKLTEGRVGFRGSIATNWRKEESSTIRSDSTQTTTDALDLRGSFELDPRFALIGPRYVPKNVGYALVVSGMADVFVLQMKRTGRMVDYQVKPVADVPLDINTVTFLINPSYQINGSVDGLVGTQAADQRIYKDVPDMRAQYGSLYPAGYFNPKQAYDIKARIDRWDEQRRTYFENFDARETGLSDSLLDQIDQQGTAGGGISLPSRTNNGGSSDDGVNSDEADELEAQAKEKQAENKSAAKNKRKEINRLFRDSDKNTEAAAAFSAWQSRMEGLQIKSAKRNIVNNYVWDGDGGLRTEEQSYANTIEHTLGGSFSLNASLGLEADISVVAVGIELSAMANLEMTQSMSKSSEQSETLELNVRLDALEHKGITDAEDYPILPGEKVDRYRFMSFYLEGETDHFHDFFNTVVDPEWLMSNDEEARALRQVAAGRANKTWRVMHRVTYVERPALMGIGRDVRIDESLEDLSEQVYSQFDDLAKDTDLIKSDLGEVSDKLSELERKIDGLAAAGRSGDAPVEVATRPDAVQTEPEQDEPAPPEDDIPETDPDRAVLMVLNEGSKQQLLKLKGIGQVRARAIMQWRRSRTFHSLDDLAEVIGRGIARDLSTEPAQQDNG